MERFDIVDDNDRVIETALGSGVFTPNFEEEWAMYQAFQRRYQAERGSGVGLCAGDSFPDLVGRVD